MKRYLLIVLFISLAALPALALYQVDFAPELIGKKFVSITKLKQTGEVAGRGETTFGKTTSNGKDYIVIKNASSIKISGHVYASRATRYYNYENGKITVYSIEGETKKDGKAYQDYRANFDWTNKTANISFNDLEKKDTQKKLINITTRMILVQDLELYLSALAARGVKQDSVKAIVPSGVTFGMLIKVAGKEDGLIRMELKIDLGLLTIVIPNVNYWLSAEPPYSLVRYAGLLSGPGSPDVVLEVTESD